MAYLKKVCHRERVGQCRCLYNGCYVKYIGNTHEKSKTRRQHTPLLAGDPHQAPGPPRVLRPPAAPQALA